MKYKTFFILFFCVLFPSNVWSLPSAPHILILNSYHSGYAWSDDIVSAIQDTLFNVYPGSVIDVEHMDTKRHPDSLYLQRLVRMYLQKFKKLNYDLVFVTDDNAFQLVRQHGKSLFPDTPVVFCGVNENDPERMSAPFPVTGVMEHYDIAKTLDLARVLQPATKHVLVINDHTTTGRAISKILQEVIPEYPDLSFEILPDSPLTTLESEVVRLPADTIVLFLVYFQDNRGHYYRPEDAVGRIAAKSTAPVYGVWDFYMGYGLACGVLTSGYLQGETAARLGLQILSGTRVQDIPILTAGASQTVCDYRELKKYGIPPSRVPSHVRMINTPYGNHKNVLVLHSYHPELQWTSDIQQGISRILKEYDPGIHVFTEYMDTKRHTGNAYFHQLYQVYHEKYARADLDLIICSDDNAYNFITRHRYALFGETPLVFCGVNAPDVLQERPANTTGVLESYDIRATLNIALALHPDAGKIFVINDNTTSGKANRQRLEQSLRDLTRDPEIEYSSDQSMAEVLERVAHLGPDTIVLLLSFQRDRNNQFFSYQESCRMICDASVRPVYGIWDFYLGQGIVGGMLTTGNIQGEEAARLGIKILSGSFANTLPVSTRDSNRYMFDDARLRAYHIDRTLLPRGILLINSKEITVVQYRMALWGALCIFALLALVIAGLWWKQKKQKMLQEQLAVEALTDPLTGVLNRRSCLQCIENHRAVALIKQKEFTVCYVDLDNLKPVNDGFGHHEGDRYIRLVSDLIQKNIRETDCLGRVGGDEFIILFCGCALEDARKIWAKIHAQIRAVDEAGQCEYPLGACAGFARFDVHNPQTSAELIAFADEDMYRMKTEKKSI